MLADVANHLGSQPPPPQKLFMPRDQIFQMQHRLYGQVFALRDARVFPYLEQFAASRGAAIRKDALQALRSLDNMKAAPIFLRALDEKETDNAFIAMMALLELAGGGPTDWVPNWGDFEKPQSFYAARCRQWWEAEGKTRAKQRAAGALSVQASENFFQY